MKGYRRSAARIGQRFAAGTGLKSVVFGPKHFFYVDRDRGRRATGICPGGWLCH